VREVYLGRSRDERSGAVVTQVADPVDMSDAEEVAS
jgi:hypothetical protein